MNDPSNLIDAAAHLAKEALRFFLPHEVAESQHIATSENECGIEQSETSSRESFGNPQH